MPGYFITLPPGSLPDHRSKVRARYRIIETRQNGSDLFRNGGKRYGTAKFPAKSPLSAALRGILWMLTGKFELNFYERDVSVPLHPATETLRLNYRALRDAGTLFDGEAHISRLGRVLEKDGIANRSRHPPIELERTPGRDSQSTPFPHSTLPPSLPPSAENHDANLSLPNCHKHNDVLDDESIWRVLERTRRCPSGITFYALTRTFPLGGNGGLSFRTDMCVSTGESRDTFPPPAG